MILGAEFKKYKKLVDEHILDFIPKIDPKSAVLYDAMKYSLTAGGKRIRPVLMLCFYNIATQGKDDLSFALPFAEAIEFIHTYSLIHDDLPAMDNDDYRRGMLTNHKVYGENIAILAGDALLSSAYEAMCKDMLLYIDKPELLNRRVKAIAALSKGVGVRGMIQGQVADVENEGKACSPEMLDFIDVNKTAAFIKSSVLCGCYLGGAIHTLLDDANIYGECIGHAFQIIDDIMDVVSTKAERGKEVGKDAECGKITYPAVHGIERSSKMASELLGKARHIIDKYDNAEIAIDIISFLEGQLA